MPVQIGRRESDFTDPTGLMSDCHRRIEMFLKVLKAAGDFDGRQLSAEERRALEAALRYFREAAPKHNADEEHSLFPRLRSLAHPEVQAALADVARLEQEHLWAAPVHATVDRLGQQWLRDGRLPGDLACAFQAAVGELESMYRTHIQYEDEILFPLAARVLSCEQRTEMAQEMAERRNLRVLSALSPSAGQGHSGGSSDIDLETTAGVTDAAPASDLLRSEHRLVETQIDSLLQAVKQPSGDIVSAVSRALSRVEKLSRPHFDKEELVFYPCFRSQFPELLAQLDAQHEYAREVERNLVELIETISGIPDARQLAELIRFSTELCDVIQHHIVEEEDQLLRLADSSLSHEEQVILAEKMEAICEPARRQT